ncbi:hypothetical protein LguiA_036308 [Lonicera macranthoides]
MGTDASPVVILDIAEEEEDDEVSVLVHPPPPATARRRRRRRGTHRHRHRHSAIAISVEDEDEDDEEEDRSLQLAIMASLFHTTPTPSHNYYNHNPNLLNNNNSVFIDLSPELTSISDDDNDDVRVLHSSRNRNRIKPSSSSSFAAVGAISIREQGESSNSNPLPYNDNTFLTTKTTTSTFMCEICVDPRPHSASFPINGCTHTYCSDCIIKYVASKLQDNIAHIPCPVPNCNGLLEPDQCRSILPPEVFDRWGSALCEALLLGSERFYCPFKDCSALLLIDDNVIITHSECPECRRLFCAQCKVGWHSGMECVDFQKLNKDEREREDIMLMKLAKDNKWTRCPNCRFFVEKTQGCLFMRCRCGYTFCYNCGAPMVSHYCSNCKH